MSALGDYVHLRTSNYLAYGVGQWKQGGKQRYQLSLATAKNQVNARINKSSRGISNEAIAKLRERLEQNTYQQEASDENTNEKNRLQQIDYLWELLAARTLGASSMNKGYGRYYGRQHITNGKQIATNAATYSGDYESLKKRAIEMRKLHTEIENLLNKITKKGFNDSKTLNSLINKYNRFQSITQSSSIDFSNIEPKSLKGIIEKAMSDVIMGSAYVNVAGYFGESLVALMDDAAENLAYNEMGKFLEKTVVGSKNSSIKLDARHINQKTFPSMYYKDEEGNIYGIEQKSFDKVDAKITVAGNKMNVSVKNYENTNKYTLSDVNLFYTLAFLDNYKRLGTHWMNMHAAVVDITNTEAENIIKKEIAFEALSYGNPFKANDGAANVFVAFNRAKGEVFVKRVDDILKNNLDSFLGLERVRDIQLINTRVEGNDIDTELAKIRISKLLTQLKNISIHVSLSRSALT